MLDKILRTIENNYIDILMVSGVLVYSFLQLPVIAKSGFITILAVSMFTIGILGILYQISAGSMPERDFADRDVSAIMYVYVADLCITLIAANFITNLFCIMCLEDTVNTTEIINTSLPLGNSTILYPIENQTPTKIGSIIASMAFVIGLIPYYKEVMNFDLLLIFANLDENQLSDVIGHIKILQQGNAIQDRRYRICQFGYFPIYYVLSINRDGESEALSLQRIMRMRILLA